MKKSIPFLVILAAASVAVANPVEAKNNNQQLPKNFGQQQQMENGQKNSNKPEVLGRVTAISGTTITVESQRGFATSTTPTVYTVDASNAVAYKDNATSTISAIAVGDMLKAEGTLNGTQLTATVVRIGFGRGPGEKNPNFKNDAASSTPVIEGDGQPVIAGLVSAVSGSTITLTNKSNIQYNIETSAAKIMRAGQTITVNDIQVGDTLMVQGTVNNTNITASTIIDQTKVAGSNATTTGATNHKQSSAFNFFSRVGQFFKHLFGL
jgi:hypothetical protein